jgi:hypothetical protein
VRRCSGNTKEGEATEEAPGQLHSVCEETKFKLG